MSKLTQKEIDFCRKNLALVMMIKNEEKRLEVSFDSVSKYTDTFVIFDTGSIDSTVSICHEYCKENKIRLFLKEGTFVDFKHSRNEMLDFADQVLKNPDGSNEKRFMLLLDCNDELRNHDELVRFINNHRGTQTGFHLKQQWWTGGSYDSYFNIRMVLSHEGWRYHQVVHEYIAKKKSKGDVHDILRLENIILFQDRTKDDDKSMRRFKRDKQLLYGAYVESRTDPRVQFYLAQTCGCLNHTVEAYQYYKIRTQYEGFIEEIYHAFSRNAEHALQLKHSPYEIFHLYLSAFAHSKRCEALVRLGEVLMNNGSSHTGFIFLNHACKLIYPHNQILFVDRRSYVYRRWNLLATCAFNIGRYFEGKEAIIHALQAESNQSDKDTLRKYSTKTNTFDDFMLFPSTSYTSMKSEQMIVSPSGQRAPIWESSYTTSKETLLQKAAACASQPKILPKQMPTESNEKVLYSWNDWSLDSPFDKDMKDIELLSDLSMPWQYIQGRYIDCYTKFCRAEPLLKIAQYYLKNNHRGNAQPDHVLSYVFASHACLLNVPIELETNPQVRFVYGYLRWHVLAIGAFAMNQYNECKNAAIKSSCFHLYKEDFNSLINIVKKDAEIRQFLTSGNDVPVLPGSLMPFDCEFGKLIPKAEKEALQQSTINVREQVLSQVI